MGQGRSTAEKSAIRPLYEQWEKDGWLHCSPEGRCSSRAVHQADWPELLGKGCQFMYWGYDKYQSKDPINSLKGHSFQSNMGIQNPDPYVQVVSQLNSEFNAPTDDLYAAMFAPVPFISLQPREPLWPALVLRQCRAGNRRAREQTPREAQPRRLVQGGPRASHHHGVGLV